MELCCRFGPRAGVQNTGVLEGLRGDRTLTVCLESRMVFKMTGRLRSPVNGADEEATGGASSGQADIQKPGGKEGARKGPQVGMGARRDLGAEQRASFKKVMGQARHC